SPFAEWEIHRAERVALRAGEERKAKGEGKAKGASREQDERRRGEQEVRSARREAESLEAEVQRLEEKIQVLETGLADSSRYSGSGESVKRAAVEAKELDKLRTQHDAVMARWLESVEKVSRL